METVWLRYVFGKKGDGSASGRSSQKSLSFPVVPDVLWIDLDNTAGLNGRRALASLIVLVSNTLPGWPSAPSLMELESRSCCHRLCWRLVGGAIGSSRCFLLQQGRIQSRPPGGLSGTWSRVSKCQTLGWAWLGAKRCSGALSASATQRGSSLWRGDLLVGMGAVCVTLGFVGWLRRKSLWCSLPTV